MRLAPPLALQCVLGTLLLHAQNPVRFSATVRAGETYTHSIGHGLYFVLKQTDAGDWDFRIKPSPGSEQSYTDCLVSPFMHGPDLTDLSAWRFASRADPDWHEELPARKKFAFVVTAEDQKYECAEKDAMYDSFQVAQRGGRKLNYSGIRNYRPRPRGQGTAVIPSLSLKPGPTGLDSEFQSVTINVTITFPPPTKAMRH